MTVETTAALIQLVYTGPGTYNFLFKVDEPDTDLEVIHTDTDGVQTVLSYGTDPGYTATIDTSFNGVVTVTDTGGVLGTTGWLLIKRVTQITQVRDWLNTGSLNLETIERAYDKLTMISQELDSKGFAPTVLGAWAALTDYDYGDVVLYSGDYYLCMVAHTSGASFDTIYWTKYIDATLGTSADEVSYDNTASTLLADNVQDAIDELDVSVADKPERYRGLWDASGGTTPTWGSLLTGDYGYISVAGTIGGVYFKVGDRIIYNGATWDKIESVGAPNKNLLRNPSWDVDHFGYVTITRSVASFPLVHGWVKAPWPVYDAAPDYIASAVRPWPLIYTSTNLREIALRADNFYRGAMYQVLEESGNELKDKDITISATVSQGSINVYMVPLTAQYAALSLTALAPYLIGTLDTTTASVSGTVPTATWATTLRYALVVVDMKTDYASHSDFANWAHFKVEYGLNPTPYERRSLVEEALIQSRYLDTSIPDFNLQAVTVKAATNNGERRYENPSNVATANFVPVNVVERNYSPGTSGVYDGRSPALTPLTGNGVYSPVTGAAGKVAVSGTDRAATLQRQGQGVWTPRNDSGVTFTANSEIRFHYLVMRELL
jgi:hypothetical protein